MSRYRGPRTGFHLAAIVLLGVLMMRPGLAEEAASGAHGDGKAPTSGESNAARAPSGEDAGRGAARPEAHAPPGDDGKARDGGPPAGNEAVKNANPSAPGDKGMGAIDTSIAPSRHLDKKNRIGEGKSANESVTRNLHRRMLSVPRPPHPAVRNAIGVPVPQHNEAERHDGVHPGPPTVPHNAPAGTVVVPATAGSHVTKIEGGVDHHVPTANPVIMPPAVNRGAITGTGLTNRNSGPAQIGGPKAAAAGVNGTTIRLKH